jgi:four helix bundle protein
MVNGKANSHNSHPHKGEKVMRPHENLEAWTKSIDLVVEIYKATERFPKEEKYSLTSQLRRAAVSVPANIAEGAGRYSAKEFAHFVSNAQGSASELETELIIAYRLGYLSETLFSQLITSLDRIGRLITGLSRHIRAN